MTGRVLERLDHLLEVVEQIRSLGVDDVVVELELLGQEALDLALEHPQRRVLGLDHLVPEDHPAASARRCGVLERQIERFLPEQLELYFDDIVDASERIWDLLDNFKEVVEALEDTNESVISHRQNDVLRILTVVSVVSYR